MYFRENERLGGFGEETGYQGPPVGAAPALAIPAAVVAAAVAALQALALVLSAMAVAWVLYQALQKARSIGIGVDWAEQKFMDAFKAVIRLAKRAIKKIEEAIEEAGKQRLPPQCERILQLLKDHLQKLQTALKVRPIGQQWGAYQEALKSVIHAAVTILNAFVNNCLKV